MMHLDDPHRDALLALKDSTAVGRDGVLAVGEIGLIESLYVAKAQKKGRTKAEVDQILRWLTGFSQDDLESEIAKRSDFETFFAEAPRLNPARAEIKGVVCGVRVEEVAEPLMREIRYLDKLVDELAKGKAMEKILRG